MKTKCALFTEELSAVIQLLFFVCDLLGSSVRPDNQFESCNEIPLLTLLLFYGFFYVNEI